MAFAYQPTRVYLNGEEMTRKVQKAVITREGGELVKAEITFLAPIILADEDGMSVYINTED